MRHGYASNKGFALVTAMIFLVLLTLVALVALRSSGLEALTSSNNAQRMEALESSETARTTIGDIVDAHVYNHGWPTTVAGGQVSTAEFGTMPAGLTIQFPTSGGCSAASGTVPNWYGSNSESTPFDPTTLDCDATYTYTTNTGNSLVTVFASLSVYKLRVDTAPGAGTAMVQGYEGVGRALAAGGGNIFFYLRSRGKDLSGSTGSSNYDTSADYRYVIRN
jgi:Tfp pilus assembly protein PilX